MEMDPIFSCSAKCSEQQPHQTTRPLSTPLPCGHSCSQSCGQCCAATIYSSEITPPLSQLLPKTVHAGTCTHPCSRQLVCGHRCAAPVCHGASECPPCPNLCAVKCPHTKYVLQYQYYIN